MADWTMLEHAGFVQDGVWTPEGRRACWRYTTPAKWLAAIERGYVRYCVRCGRDLCRRNVARVLDSPLHCVCLVCARREQTHG